jgi:tRNA-2-methylthio-N6-dimethylallyladenosine synthase
MTENRIEAVSPAPATIPPRRGKLFIETHGCQMNEYDSTKMADVLAEHEGLELTDNAAEADVILVNTCSSRE